MVAFEVPQHELTNPGGIGEHVSDEAQILSESIERAVNQRWDGMATQKESDFIFVITRDSGDLKKISEEAFSSWRVGKDSPRGGFLVVIGVEPRRIYAESTLEWRESVGLAWQDQVRAQLQTNLQSDEYVVASILTDLAARVERLEKVSEILPETTVPTKQMFPVVAHQETRNFSWWWGVVALVVGVLAGALAYKRIGKAGPAPKASQSEETEESSKTMAA